jgi:2-polyprenyl-3-methyl-5-hydroxy-6-metoxy-1,4-benzoquinol methylase
MIDTLERDLVCPICESVESVFLFHPIDYSGLTAPQSLGIVKCSECGLPRLEPRLREEDAARIYQGDYWQLDVQVANLYQSMCRSYRCRLRFLESVSKPARTLDVGCGHGGYVWLLRQNGWNAYGMDAFPGAAGQARTIFGLDISTGTLHDCGYAPGSFQIITMHHVLEHIYDPVGLLTEVAHLLADDGVLILEVPNGQSLEFLLFRGYAYGLRTPKHVFFYGPKTLARLLAKVGRFQVIGTSHLSQPHSAAYAREGLKRVLGNLDRTIFAPKLRYVRLEGMSTSVRQTSANLPESTAKQLFLNASGTVLARLWCIMKRGAVITVAARKMPV